MVQQSWEIPDTRGDGWEQGQGGFRGTEGQEGAQPAEGVAALQLSLGKLEDRGRGRVVWCDCCGPCCWSLHCSGHVPSGEGMDDTWHGGSQQFFLFPVSAAFLFLGILGHHSRRALLRCESRSR